MGTQKLNQKGFTLVELLLVILVVAILSVVGITQFTNFGKDAREAAVKANLQTLRLGIAAQNAMMRNRCGVVGSLWPPLAALQANDITVIDATDSNAGMSTVAVCTGAQIGNTMDQKFIAVGLPANPWIDPLDVAGGNQAKVDDGFAGHSGAAAGQDCGIAGAGSGAGSAGGTRGSGTAYGWCYNEGTGEIWANSTCNDGVTPCAGTGTENTY